MPRTTRAHSEYDLYHVMVRGINQVQLFYDDADRREFLVRLWRYRDACGVPVLSWCLMANHVHLLLRAELDDLATFMKRLQLSYSRYYNDRYDRSGYLYQGRFESVAIKSEPQLLNVIGYIHRNPLEVGLSVSTWTSFDDIENASGATDSAELLLLLDGDQERAKRAFVRLVTDTSGNGPHPEHEKRRRIDDETAAATLKRLADTKSCQALCDLDADARNRVIASARAEGLTVRQIARLTGLNRGIVQRAGVSGETSP